MTTNGKSDFTDVDPATILQPAPLGVGVYGYGGAGKTETALRLAFGIQRVYGGEVFYADTESRKGLAYRKLFPFRYIDFRAPHNALRYIELLQTFADRKGVLVIDTFTEEHDGEGGMLETQADAKDGKESRNAVAWALAKGQHKKLPRVLRRALQTMPVVGTWRAEDKTDWNHKGQNGKIEPIPKGEMPIGSRDVPFEMTLHFLMRAGARGVPCLVPETYGEHVMTKIPRWFDGLFKPGQPITEDHGEAIARWAMAEATPPAADSPRFAELHTAIGAAENDDAIKAIGARVKALLASKELSKPEASRLSAAAGERRKALGGNGASRSSDTAPPAAEPGIDAHGQPT